MDGVRRLEQVLTTKKRENLEILRRDLPDDDHLTAPIHGFYIGSRLAFRPWFFKIDDTDDAKTLYATRAANAFMEGLPEFRDSVAFSPIYQQAPAVIAQVRVGIRPARSLLLQEVLLGRP